MRSRKKRRRRLGEEVKKKKKNAERFNFVLPPVFRRFRKWSIDPFIDLDCHPYDSTDRNARSAGAKTEKKRQQRANGCEHPLFSRALPQKCRRRPFSPCFSFLKKSLLHTLAPSAGPTGGAGLAFPAGRASLMYPATVEKIECFEKERERKRGRIVVSEKSIVDREKKGSSRFVPPGTQALFFRFSIRKKKKCCLVLSRQSKETQKIQ